MTDDSMTEFWTDYGHIQPELESRLRESLILRCLAEEHETALGRGGQAHDGSHAPVPRSHCVTVGSTLSRVSSIPNVEMILAGTLS